MRDLWICPESNSRHAWSSDDPGTGEGRQCVDCGITQWTCEHGLVNDEPDPEIDIDGSLADREADRYEQFLDSMWP